MFFLLQDQSGYFRPDIQPVDPVRMSPDGCEQDVSFLRQNLPVGACQEEGDPGAFQLMQRRQHAYQDLSYFTKRGLLVVERIEQAEDQDGVRMLSPANIRQPVYDGLLHLVAGKAP